MKTSRFKITKDGYGKYFVYGEKFSGVDVFTGNLKYEFKKQQTFEHLREAEKYIEDTCIEEKNKEEILVKEVIVIR